MKNQRMTIMIISCDLYRELWDCTFHFFDKNWPDCPYPKLLVSDKKTDYVRDGVQVLAIEGRDFGGRINEACQSVHTPYVLFVPEEYWVTKPIKSDQIEYLLDLMEKNDLGYLRMQQYQRLKKGRRIGNGVRSIAIERSFDVDNHPFIARTEILQGGAAADEEAHVYERRLSKRYLAMGVEAAYAKKRYFPFQEALTRGLFFRRAYRMALLSGCYRGGRREMTSWEECKFNAHIKPRDWCPRWLYAIIRRQAHKKGHLLAGEEPEDLTI
jgi:hypothetical protein